jgi:hypothetical protein
MPDAGDVEALSDLMALLTTARAEIAAPAPAAAAPIAPAEPATEQPATTASNEPKSTKRKLFRAA